MSENNLNSDLKSANYDNLLNLGLDNLPMPVLIINKNRVVVECNHALVDFCKLQSKKQILGKKYMNLSHIYKIEGEKYEEKFEDFRQKVYSRALSTYNWVLTIEGVKYKVTLNWKRFVHNDMQYFQVSVVNSSIISPYDILPDIIGINEDENIDELNREHRGDTIYKKILNSLDELVYVLNKDFEIIDVNNKVLSHYGYSKKEIIGKSPDYFSESTLNDDEQVKKQLTAAYNGSPQEFIFWSRKKDGSVFPKSTNVFSGIYWGKDVVVAIGKDISNQVELERALNDSEKRYRILFELMPQGIINFDKDGNVIDINGSACKILGLSASDITNRKYIRENVMLICDNNGPYKEDESFVITSFRTGKPVIDKIVQLHNKKLNLKRWVVANAVPLFPVGAQEPNQVFVTLEDITSIKKTKLELLKAKEKAEESDRLKSAFLANISHEIRTPMNGILGFANLLKRDNLTGDKKQHYVDIIIQSGNRMLSLINDLVNISKIESGQVDVFKEKININEKLDYVCSFFIPDIKSKNMEISIKKSLPDKEACIMTDAEKFYAILTNLVKNSIKYSEKGIIEFGYNVEGDFIEFYVKDNGIGIPESDLDKIFNRFVQAKNVSVNSSQGVGLGLAITKGYVEMLGGKIWVESKQDVGSTFYFTLPNEKELKVEN